MGVSIGISNELVQATATSTAATLLSRLTRRPIIDFLKQLVVLLDQRVARLELERLLVGGSCLRKVAFVLVCDGEIVVRGGVGGIDLGGALPAVNRLAPQTTLCHGDPELHLLLRVVAGICRERRGRKRQNGDHQSGDSHLERVSHHYSHSLARGARALSVKSLAVRSKPRTTGSPAFGRTVVFVVVPSVPRSFVERRQFVANSKVGCL